MQRGHRSPWVHSEGSEPKLLPVRSNFSGHAEDPPLGMLLQASCCVESRRAHVKRNRRPCADDCVVRVISAVAKLTCYGQFRSVCTEI
eukprot:364834-Chlamydomonas_euryale.AAC.6